ncbi:MAG: preprotein translocase subunit SecA [Planctomycetota bacterium]|jgi:preprotein translocase subunit SecA
MLGKVRKALGIPSRNERIVKAMEAKVAEINSFEPALEGLSDEQLAGKTAEFRDRLAAGVALDDLLPEAYACVRESSRRHLKTATGVAMRHFDVQMIGGIVLHQGGIAEMMTGEGKTLVATLPTYLNALPGAGVHVVTVNDYLAQRDADWMRPVFEGLGMTVGAIQSNMGNAERHLAYACDITYGTNNEFGFDYLRDNMKVRPQDQVQKRRHFALIDEVDSILIDEARTPLIISGPAEKSGGIYSKADSVVRKLRLGEHFEVKEKEQTVYLTEEGIEAAERLVGLESFYSPGNMHWPHHLEQALKAHHLHKIDVDYVVKDGGIVIVDEFTGRLMDGRRWSDGLHQAVEAKEGLKIADENQTLATITFQNFFRLYDKLAGMTGTAMTEAEEFREIYGLEAVQIPTNRPVARDDQNDVVYRTRNEKWNAITDTIFEVQKAGRPILVGTASIESSELLSSRLTRRGIAHNVLNAKHHEREADIIAEAGQPGKVTIATNMAGRGTDIQLGPGVKEMGGLMVIGSERHESRRIDNQLRGRCGRQGDPGTTTFFLSLEDDLMRIFASDRVSALLKRFGMDEGVDISSPIVSRAIERAQKKVEQRNFEIRKNLLEYDGVMDQQRKLIYRIRHQVLMSEDLEELVVEHVGDTVRDHGSELLAIESEKDDQGERVAEWVRERYAVGLPTEITSTSDIQRYVDGTQAGYRRMLADKQEAFGDQFTAVLHYIMLRAIDDKWKDHLREMDHLRAGVSMRGYGQLDPKLEYKREGFRSFTEMLHSLKEEYCSLVPRIQIRIDEEEAERELASTWQGSSAVSGAQVEQQFREHGARQDRVIDSTKQKGPAKPIVNTQPKVGRNDDCPCGSGRKYKKCCGKLGGD